MKPLITRAISCYVIISFKPFNVTLMKNFADWINVKSSFGFFNRTQIFHVWVEQWWRNMRTIKFSSGAFLTTYSYIRRRKQSHFPSRRQFFAAQTSEQKNGLARSAIKLPVLSWKYKNLYKPTCENANRMSFNIEKATLEYWLHKTRKNHVKCLKTITRMK